MRVLRAMCMAVGAGFAAAQPFGSGPAWAVNDYDACINLIALDPARAEQDAGEWARFGGGAGARHCYALALVALGAPVRGADEMISIATEEPGLTDDARVDLLVQAGTLLQDAGDDLTVSLVITQALRIRANDPGALGLRARQRLAQGSVRAALSDLNQALRGAPRNVTLLSLRASAYRRAGELVAARADSLFATEVDPDSASAWLERGRVEAKADDKPAARQSFLTAIKLDRGGKLATAARNALQRMEAGYSE